MTRSVLIVAFSLAVLACASVWQWGANLGDGPSTVCLSRPAPAAVGTDMNWVPEARQSWWPLGVTCRWTHQVTGESVETGPGGGPSGVAIAAFGGGVIGVALLIGEVRSRPRRAGVIPGR